MVHCWVVVMGLLLVTSTFSKADLTPSKEPIYWGIQSENDLFGSGDDRFYTNGLQINATQRNTPPAWLQGWVTELPFFIMGDIKGGDYSFGQKIFTPTDVESTAVVKDDRPYAGWLYWGSSVASMIKKEPQQQEMNAFEIVFGIVGPSSQAEYVQNEFHRLMALDVSNGWKNQLKDELGVVATYVRKSEYFSSLNSGLEYSWSPHRVVALGNVYSYVGSGVMFRFGQHLRNDIGPPNISPGFPGASFFSAAKEGKGWYVFGGIEGRVMAQNIFLDGNTFQESHRVKKERFVLDFQYGLAYQYRNVRVSFSNIVRSKEFEQQQGNVAFGAINVSFFLND